MRKSLKVVEMIPVLNLRGLSTGDFREDLPILLGKEASGLSPTAIARMTNVWQDEYREFRSRSRADKNYLYESKESWKSILEDLKCRGMRAPLILTGDGTLDSWACP